MCTAIAHKCGNLYFGRTLDLEYSYKETVTITPRNAPLSFRRAGTMAAHYAIYGIATVAEAYPLYYDAANERGLCMAALHFPTHAIYRKEESERENITPFELMPWVLGRCASIREARELLLRTNLVSIPFSDAYPLTPLHWLIADAEGSLVVEPGETGLALYENPTGVLTNNPPFPMQMFALQPYRALCPDSPPPAFGDHALWQDYSRGLGSLGLPGDFTSPSRFVRAVFASMNSTTPSDESARIGQFFHLLDPVQIPSGCVRTADGKYVTTVYTSCYSPAEKSVYYTTAENRQLTCVRLSDHPLDSSSLISYPLHRTERIYVEAPENNA